MTIANDSDRRSSTLESRLDEPYAEAWRPAPGESLIGEVAALDTRISSYDGTTPYPVVTVRRADGTTAAFHGYHTVAKAELAKLEPQIGESIGIKYIGKPPGKGYEAYRIVLDRNRPAVDWQKMASEGSGEAAADGPSDNADSIPF
jgi:hypothetical protein